MAKYINNGPLVGAIDQGTSSTRFLVFDPRTAELVGEHQTEIKQSFPKEGWVEQDPMEIMRTVHECIQKAMENLREKGIDSSQIKAIGICNQRETTILWDKTTGRPLHNAIVWSDGRTVGTVEELINRCPDKNKEHLKPRCGLPLSTYFSAVKIKWLMDHETEVNMALEDGRCLFGTVDSWIIWNLTGGKDGGIHVTDVTNASRTMMMNLETLDWDPSLYKFFGVPPAILPVIKSSSEIYGRVSSGPIEGTPIAGCLGDQSAALVGQTCFNSGQAKNTYGTGCFMLCNTGTQPIYSERGMLTTVAYKLGRDSAVRYALEGSIAVAGSCVRWLRDNLGIIKDAAEIEPLASSVTSTSDVYFVPAFSGLYAPYWDPNARGVMIGLTQYTTKAHLARAALEAICYQTKEIVQAIDKEMGSSLSALQVDGGMSTNEVLMQLQADILGIPVVRPSMKETTALGAAMAAGRAEGIGVWPLHVEEAPNITKDVYTPTTGDYERSVGFARWKQAVSRSMQWATSSYDDTPDRYPGSHHLP